jgi:cell division protein FtsB
MPSARSATATSRRQARPSPRRPPRVVSRPPKLRVRWERVGRIGLLVVFAVVVGLYVEHTLSYFSTRSQADQQQAIVRSLSRQNAQLTQEQKSLNDPSTIIGDARALGMVRPGEQPYVVMGSGGH